MYEPCLKLPCNKNFNFAMWGVSHTQKNTSCSFIVARVCKITRNHHVFPQVTNCINNVMWLELMSCYGVDWIIHGQQCTVERSNWTKSVILAQVVLRVKFNLSVD